MGFACAGRTAWEPPPRRGDRVLGSQSNPEAQERGWAAARPGSTLPLPVYFGLVGKL